VVLDCGAADVLLNDGDKSALIAAIEKAQTYGEEDYSSESYNRLVATYSSHGNLVDSFATQSQIDAATTEILTAIRELVPYLFLTVKADNGTVEVNDDSNAKKYKLMFGDSITMKAIADDGYVFDGWYETVTQRIRSTDPTFTFKITSNTDFEARFEKENSATLSFESADGWIAGKVDKTIREWQEVTTLNNLLPKVPYKLGYTNGRWVYDSDAVLQKLRSGENVMITPEYDAADYENPIVPTPVDNVPALNLYYHLDEDNDVGSFTMAAGLPTDCQVESVGIALYYKNQAEFNPADFELTIHNQITTSKFVPNNSDGVYILDINKFSDKYNWAVRGYVTYYDLYGKLTVAYSNQVNIVERQQMNSEHIHHYSAVVTQPDCTNRGYVTYTCTECGYRFIGDYTDALGHAWSEWSVNGNERTRVCSRCGTADTEIIAEKAIASMELLMSGEPAMIQSDSVEQYVLQFIPALASVDHSLLVT
jgi:uncharacterized repeat protein (TIGR02543 family)